MVRLDGQYGTAAVLADLAGLACVTRSQDYHLLERGEEQTRLHLPPDQQIIHPESGVARALYDCPAVSISGHSPPCRIIFATHPALEKKSRVVSTRAGAVYELFLTALPQDAFTVADVVALYLHRGAFEPALSDEDQEQNPDRWCSHVVCGQECWQIVCQWVWNLRLELGHHLSPEPVRTGVCSRPDLPTSGGNALASSRAGLWTSRARSVLETRPLFWPRLCSLARWHAALPGRPDTDPA